MSQSGSTTGAPAAVVYHSEMGDRIALGPHVLSDREVVALACGLKGSTVSVMPGLASFNWNGRRHQQSSIELRVDCPEKLIKPTVRHILKGRVAGEPRLFMYNQYFCLRPIYQGYGIATMALGLQIKVALAANITAVFLYAAGSAGSQYNGYWVWPKLGYEGRIPDDIWGGLPDEGLTDVGLDPRQPTTIQELYASGGENLWRNAGEGYDMYFRVDARRMAVARLFNKLRGTAS